MSWPFYPDPSPQEETKHDIQMRVIREHRQRMAERPKDIPADIYYAPGHPMHGDVLQRRETGLLEARCAHGIGHPIPESCEWLDAFGSEGAVGSWGVHGCDGCCRKERDGVKMEEPAT